MKSVFFNKFREIIADINGFLDSVQESSLIFQKGIKLYIKGDMEKFDNNLKRMAKLESRADNYQKSIKYKLYKYMLIPESRGYVLTILENTDNVTDLSKKVLAHFSIERPEIPECLEEDFLELTEQSIQSVNALVKAIRSYFEEISIANDYINKVQFYEQQVDELEEIMERKVFTSTAIEKFYKKTHVRDFIEKIARISDQAENVADILSVAIIKRSI